MRVARRCSAGKGTNTSKRSDRYQCALASNVEKIEPPQTKQLLQLRVARGARRAARPLRNQRIGIQRALRALSSVTSRLSAKKRAPAKRGEGWYPECGLRCRYRIGC